MTVNENDQQNVTRTFNVMTDGVKWLEKYGNGMERIFTKLPKFLSSFISTLAIVTFGATLRGEWTIIFVMLWKQLGLGMFSNDNQTMSYSELSMKTLKMENFLSFFISSMTVSYLVYFTVGGFLHWYFYVQRKDTPHEWKIQPEKWLPIELELHEIMVGCTSLLCTGTFSGALGCYIANGNPSQVYYQFDEYGWWWFFLQIPVIFIYQDYTTYCLHRLYHTPFLYKHFHKLHHKYKQPTAFSVTAIHPVEIIHVQLTMCLPLFTIPTHWVAFYGVALYTYYHGIIDHSGINFKGQWWQPWQPDAEFHDKHHQLFHVNYSFNIKYWDKLHGTDVRKNRVYTEETFECVRPILKNENDDDDIKKKIVPDQNGNIYNSKIEEVKNGHVGNGHLKES